MKHRVSGINLHPKTPGRRGSAATGFTIFRMALPAAIGAALGFAAGRSESPARTPATEAAPVNGAAQPRAAMMPARRDSSSRPQLAAARQERDEDEREAEATYRREQSKEVFDLMSQRMKLAMAGMRDNPEAVATYMSMYQTGMAETLMRGAPELIPELAKHIEDSLCDPKASDAQLMVMTQIAGQVPELGTQTGFDCIFQKRKREDLVLWRALEAFRQTGLPRTPGIEQLERSAVNEHTRLRLKEQDEPAEMAAKAALGLSAPTLEMAPQHIDSLLKRGQP